MSPPLLELAQANPDAKLFDWCSIGDIVLKRYAALAGIHPSKAHYHVLKHSICVLLWQKTHDLNAIQDHVGHRSSSSTLARPPKEAPVKPEVTPKDKKPEVTVTYTRRVLTPEEQAAHDWTPASGSFMAKWTNTERMKVRQDRLGHADPRTTMGYTHVIGDDHRKVAEQLGGFFAQVRLNLPKKRSGSREESSQAAEV